MLALHRSGRTPEALAVYAQTRRRFTDELGIEPGRGLQELHVQVLQRNEPAFAPVARPAQLPHDVRGFTGRQAELVRLDDAGIWVITGAAGVGKTALAVHWERRVRDRFPDGQLYVDLRGFDADHEPVPQTIALAQLLRALGSSGCRPKWTSWPRCTGPCWRTGRCWCCWTTRGTPSRSCRCCRRPGRCW